MTEQNPIRTCAYCGEDISYFHPSLTTCRASECLAKRESDRLQRKSELYSEYHRRKREDSEWVEKKREKQRELYRRKREDPKWVELKREEQRAIRERRRKNREEELKSD